MDLQRKAIAEMLGTLWLVLGGTGAAVLAAIFLSDFQDGDRQHRHRLPRRLPGLRPDRRDRGVRPRPHLGGPLQPGHHARRAGRQAHRGARGDRLHRRPGRRRHPRLGDRPRHRHRGRQLHPRSPARARTRWRPTGSPTTHPVATPGGRRWWPRSCSRSSSCWWSSGSRAGALPAGFAPLAIGLSLTLIHLISIPVTNTSVNPARSTGPAVFVGGWALEQLWFFWVAPIVGAVLAGWCTTS